MIVSGYNSNTFMQVSFEELFLTAPGVFEESFCIGSNEDIHSKNRIKSFINTKNVDVLLAVERKIIRYLQGSLPLYNLNLTKENARSFLSSVKLIDNVFDEENRIGRIDFKLENSSYELRTWILALCSPLMKTCEVYTKTLNPNEMTDSTYLANPVHWVAERVALHMHILSLEFIRALALSKRLNSETPSIWAVRGNTGVGKTYSISHEPLFKNALDENGHIKGSINPDYFKAFLKRSTAIHNRLFLVNNQVHFEGFELCNRYMHAMSTEKLKSSLIVDYTLTSIQQLKSHVLTPIRLRNGKAFLSDIDAPFLRSINRVFIRDPYGLDPCVILDAIKEGFLEARQRRREIIEIIKHDPRIDRYKLYVHDYNGIRRLAAEKKYGQFIIHSQELLDLSCSVSSSEDVDAQIKQVITKEYIDQAIIKGDIPENKRYLLERWLGMTIEKALEMHIYNISEQQALSEFCENALTDFYIGDPENEIRFVSNFNLDDSTLNEIHFQVSQLNENSSNLLVNFSEKNFDSNLVFQFLKQVFIYLAIKLIVKSTIQTPLEPYKL